MTLVKHIGADDFEREVMESDLPVLVDFYADWCGPCRMMAPVLERVATRLAGRASVVKVDTDQNPELAQTFRVSSIPALYVLRGGRVVDRAVGLTSEEQLISMLERAASPVAVAR